MSFSARRDGIGDEDGDIRHLFSYNLQRLSGVSSRIALLRIRSDFSLSTLEWRVLAVLDFLGVATLQLLSSRAGVQKSQLSRTVTALVAAGVIQREDNPRDKRSVHLSLTEKGREIVGEVLNDSRARNREMLRELSQEERVQLMALLEKVTVGSLAYLRELKGFAQVVEPPAPISALETEII